MAVEITLLTILLLVALWTVMTTRLLRSVVGLAATSVVLSIIMFRLNSHIAAVFELSVCAGLIFVIFITTVSFTHRVSKERLIERRKERMIKFWYLPFIIIIIGVILSCLKVVIDFRLPPPAAEQDVRNVLWNLRHIDLVGQAVALLAGAFGVVVLFREVKK